MLRELFLAISHGKPTLGARRSRIGVLALFGYSFKLPSLFVITSSSALAARTDYRRMAACLGLFSARGRKLGRLTKGLGVGVLSHALFAELPFVAAEMTIDQVVIVFFSTNYERWPLAWFGFF
jgi:hypothetical protein